MKLFTLYDDADSLDVPVLTIAQPYAHLIMSGIKRVENRTWNLAMRGKLWIHSAKSVSRADVAYYREAGQLEAGAVLHTGSILGHVTIIDSVPVKKLPAELRRQQREFIDGPFCFILADPVLLPAPIPARGKLGIWRHILPTNA